MWVVVAGSFPFDSFVQLEGAAPWEGRCSSSVTPSGLRLVPYQPRDQLEFRVANWDDSILQRTQVVARFMWAKGIGEKKIVRRAFNIERRENAREKKAGKLPIALSRSSANGSGWVRVSEPLI